ncbi:MAG: dethiobiotin synthase [Candidatus Thiodiazotropha sp. (ex Myrtea spinifera)]|nr:dethiobiotin synthase [Candidatus Thiodiazotropha sp. (ex Myrtea spinifera)]MCU7828104.1 dethiobiotin synthase [Candidatus Thiodiazotropha sp. (ex Myrtea sp. 'scaly one' KF741663)]
MARGLFITGTDTGCGKTEITLGLMHKLQQRGDRVLGMKPVASGADETVEGLRNEDALRIQSQCSQQVSYDLINPYAYAPPIAPHLAAEAAGRPIDPQQLVDICTRLGSMADSILVEGVGGWSVPLNEDHTLGDLANLLDLPVILVVGLKLGCINHALMTESCINHSGSRLLGWVANQVDTAMDAREGNLRTLSERLSAPCLGVVPWLEQPTPAEVAGYLDDSLL